MAYSNKHIRVETKKTAITKYSAQQSYEKNLKTLNDSAKFNQDIYDMGTEWFNLGYSIDEAP